MSIINKDHGLLHNSPLRIPYNREQEQEKLSSERIALSLEIGNTFTRSLGPKGPQGELDVNGSTKSGILSLSISRDREDTRWVALGRRSWSDLGNYCYQLVDSCLIYKKGIFVV